MTETVERVKNSTSRRADRQERLLDVFARLVVRYGYDKTSVEDIAREAGVSKGAVYLHWRSKEALFDATLVREAQRQLDDLLARVEADPEGGTLAAIYLHGMLGIADNPLILALYTRDARTLGDYVRRQPPARNQQRMIFGQEFVRRMQAADLMRADLDPEVTTYLMAVISFGLLSVRQLGGAVSAPTLEDTASALADLIHRGFASGTRGSSDAGKRALRALLDETKRLLASSGS